MDLSIAESVYDFVLEDIVEKRGSIPIDKTIAKRIYCPSIAKSNALGGILNLHIDKIIKVKPDTANSKTPVIGLSNYYVKPDDFVEEQDLKNIKQNWRKASISNFTSQIYFNKVRYFIDFVVIEENGKANGYLEETIKDRVSDETFNTFKDFYEG